MKFQAAAIGQVHVGKDHVELGRVQVYNLGDGGVVVDAAWAEVIVQRLTNEAGGIQVVFDQEQNVGVDHRQGGSPSEAQKELQRVDRRKLGGG